MSLMFLEMYVLYVNVKLFCFLSMYVFLFVVKNKKVKGLTSVTGAQSEAFHQVKVLVEMFCHNAWNDLSIFSYWCSV